MLKHGRLYIMRRVAARLARKGQLAIQHSLRRLLLSTRSSPPSVCVLRGAYRSRAHEQSLFVLHTGTASIGPPCHAPPAGPCVRRRCHSGLGCTRDRSMKSAFLIGQFTQYQASDPQPPWRCRRRRIRPLSIACLSAPSRPASTAALFLLAKRQQTLDGLVLHTSRNKRWYPHVLRSKTTSNTSICPAVQLRQLQPEHLCARSTTLAMKTSPASPAGPVTCPSMARRVGFSQEHALLHLPELTSASLRCTGLGQSS